MTTDRDFDRLARAWLETGPDEAPDRVIAAVLQAAETTPQVRRGLRRPFRRSVTMTRLSMAAGGGRDPRRRRRHPLHRLAAIDQRRRAHAIGRAIADGLGLRRRYRRPVPPQLQGTWVAPPRSVSGLLPTLRYRIQLTDQGFRMPDDNLSSAQLVRRHPRPVRRPSSWSRAAALPPYVIQEPPGTTPGRCRPAGCAST